MRRTTGLLMAMLLVVAASVAGTVRVAGARAVAFVRVAYLPPDGPPVDVYVNSTRALGGAAYKTVSTYLEVSPGTHTLAVRTAGAAPTATPSAQVIQSFGAGTYSTVAMGGRFGSLQAVVLPDRFTAPGRQAEVRFVHMAPDVPAVDVAVTGGPVVFSNIAFLQASDYRVLPSGTYNLELRATGTDNVLFSAPGVAAAGATVHSFTGIGGVGQPVELLPIVDAVGATAVPVGAAATGGGGTAPAPATAAAATWASLLAVAVLGMTCRRARRRSV